MTRPVITTSYNPRTGIGQAYSYLLDRAGNFILDRAGNNIIVKDSDGDIFLNVYNTRTIISTNYN